MKIVIAATGLLLFPFFVQAEEVNYDDPNLAFNTAQTEADGGACTTIDGSQASLDSCLQAQGLLDIEQAGGAVSLSRHFAGKKSLIAEPLRIPASQQRKKAKNQDQ